MLLALAAAASNYGRTTLGPLQEALRTAFTASDNQIALLQGAALAIPQVLSAIPLGILVDRHSRIRLLLAFAALNVLANFLTAFAPSFTVVFIARCLIGLTVTATPPAILSLIGDLYPASQRGRATMTTHVASVLGLSVTFALGGHLLQHFSSGPNGWRSAMIWLTSPLIVVVLSLLGLREPSRTEATLKSPSLRQAAVELWRCRSVVGLLVVGWSMVQIGDMSALIWATPMFSRRFSLPPDRTGAIMAIVLFVGGLIGPLAGGTLADFCQRSRGPRRTVTLLTMLALLSLPSSLFAIAGGATEASILLAFFITLGTAIGTSTMTLSIVVVPNELRGLCIALYNTAGAIFGAGLAPLTVSLTSTAIGGPAKIGQALTLVGATTAVLGTLTFVLARRYFPCGVRGPRPQ